MSFFRVAFREFSRLWSTKMRRLALVALITIPSLYTGLYLYSNIDPYGKMSNVPVAIVQSDVPVTIESSIPSTGGGDSSSGGDSNGVTSKDGKITLDLGKEVFNSIMKMHPFDLQETTFDDAVKGIDSGKYTFGIHIKKDFSKNLSTIYTAILGDGSAETQAEGDSSGSSDASTGEDASYTEPKAAEIELITNDANSYIAHTAANTAGESINQIITQQVNETLAKSLLQGLQTIRASLNEAADGSGQITDGLGEVKAKLPEALSGIAALKDGTSELVSGIEEMKDKASALPAGIKQLKDGADQLAAGTAELKKSVAPLPDAIKQLKDGAQQVADGDQQIDQIADQIAAIEKSINNDWENDIKPKIIAQINDSVIPDFLKQELLKFVDDVDKIIVDIHDTVTFDISEIDELAWGAAQVANGMGELDAQIPALISGIDQLASGAEQLANGINQLNDQIPALLSGIDQLLAGAKQLDAGAEELKEGLEALPPGIDQLYDGSDTLTKALYGGIKLVPMLTDSQIDSISKVVASPVDITDTSKATASGYSEGLMPFFVALSAWVGAYALFIIVQPFSKRTLLAGMRPMKVAIGGWIFPTMVSIVQLGCVFFIVNVLLGMPSENLLLSWLFFMLISCCYVSILYCLVAALEKVGLFIGLVLLILQLTSSGGTFPWQTTPMFFHYLHDLLPMGYAVDAIRRLFYGAALSPVILDVAVLVGYTFIFLVIGSIIVRKKRTFTIKGLTPAI